MRNPQVLAILLIILLTGCGMSGDAAQSSSPKNAGNAVESESAESESTGEAESEEMSESLASVVPSPSIIPGPDSGSSISPEPADSASPVPEQEDVPAIDDLAPGTTVDASYIRSVTDYFKKYEITEGGEVWQRIIGKSYRENDDIALADLRYLKMIHYNYNHEVQVGEMIVNAEIADDTLQVFRELYESGYEIERMFLVDDYWTGDAAKTDVNSMEHNNTSAFNYRMTTSGKSLSNHALGYAIDVNPLQNPYVYKDSTGRVSVSPENASQYNDRTKENSHIITSGDLCQSTFEKYGFSWGGYWSNPVDYQHFEK